MDRLNLSADPTYSTSRFFQEQTCKLLFGFAGQWNYQRPPRPKRYKHLNLQKEPVEWKAVCQKTGLPISDSSATTFAPAFSNPPKSRYTRQKMNEKPTTEVYDSWQVDVPSGIRNTLLKNNVFAPEDLRTAKFGLNLGRKFDQIQKLKAELGFDLLEPFNYHTWPVEVDSLIHKKLREHGIGTPSDLEHAEITLTPKKHDALMKLRASLGFEEVRKEKFQDAAPESLKKVHWKESGLKINTRVEGLLQTYQLDTVDDIAKFIDEGSVVCPESGSSIPASEIPNFGESSLQQLRAEFEKLCELGYDGYRNDGLENINTFSELVAVIRKTLTASEAKVFLSSEKPNVFAKKHGHSSAHITQTNNRCMAKISAGESAKAKKFLDRCWGPNRSRIAVSVHEVTSMTGIADGNEILLLNKISKAGYFWDERAGVLFNGTKLQKKEIADALNKLESREIKFNEQGIFHFQPENGPAREINRAEYRHLLTDKTIAGKYASQISANKFASDKASSNGLAFTELYPSGLFGDAEGLMTFLNANSNRDFGVSPSGGIRLINKSTARSDDVVNVLKHTKHPLTWQEIKDKTQHAWKHPNKLTNELSDRLETILTATGSYVHIETLGLTYEDVRILGSWAEQKLRNTAELVSFAKLFEEYKTTNELPYVESAFQLSSCAIKHASVKRYQGTEKVHHVETYQDEQFLRQTHPAIASEWHQEKNEGVEPDQVKPHSSKTYWWTCSEGHDYPRPVCDRTSGGLGCPHCNDRRTPTKIRGVVEGLLPVLPHTDPSMRYAIFEHLGLSNYEGQHAEFLKNIRSGKLPMEAVKEFVGNESDVDEYQDTDLPETDSRPALQSENDGEIPEVDTGELGAGRSSDDAYASDENLNLPEVSAADALASLDHIVQSVFQSADGETAEFLIEKTKANIWRHAYRDENQAFEELCKYETKGEFSERVKREFLSEFNAAKNLKVPQGYSFHVDGNPAQPNLMQRHVASMVQLHRRYGNWSGTGAGKTLSAILATRVTGSRLTVICCPNAVVGDENNGWTGAIKNIYPDSEVQSKTFEPIWNREDSFKYLVLNYERFQQPDSEARVKQFVESNKVDFVVIDEIHFVKQRGGTTKKEKEETKKKLSKRRRLVQGLIVASSESNADMCVLGMSATPVINDLQEGISLIELITGESHDDLGNRATLKNCNRLHQKLVTHGTRWKPNYRIGLETLFPEVDCSDFIEEVRDLGPKANPLAVEQILTRARLPEILKHLSSDKPTVIYSYFVRDIVRVLREAVHDAGLKADYYTGEDKSGLELFKQGKTDVLIASGAIGTGVDGLQKCCSQLIINVLPWTNAEYEQLIGRIWRQGQVDDTVKVIVPKTGAIVGGELWSYCQSKLDRINYKKTVADAVVDGEVPEGRLRSVAQANRDVLRWLDRLADGDIHSISRRKIEVPLSGDAEDVQRRWAQYGDFSKMNGIWNRSRSETLAEKLKKDPEEWCNYHTLYQQARNDWVVVPFEEMIQRYRNRPKQSRTIGDFGCGENLLMEGLGEHQTVHAFDHIAISVSLRPNSTSDLRFKRYQLI